MRTSKFTDSQTLAILKEYESGQTAKELSRNMVSTTKLCTIGKRNLVG
ncbi:hypothetical protein [uncultured Chryseobacterium sp.]|nr:hypothetical protein [uncultured Chryseobacterium sp.]